jgi:hypothetical protein
VTADPADEDPTSEERAIEAWEARDQVARQTDDA